MAFDFGNMMSSINPELIKKLFSQYQGGQFGGGANPNAPAFGNFGSSVAGMFGGGQKPPIEKFDTGAGYQNFQGSGPVQQPGQAFQHGMGGPNMIQGAAGLHPFGNQNPQGQPVGQPAPAPAPAPAVNKGGGFSDPYENWKRQGRPGGDFNKWMAQR